MKMCPQTIQPNQLLFKAQVFSHFLPTAPANRNNDIFRIPVSSSSLQRTRITFDEDGNATTVIKEEVVSLKTTDEALNDNLENTEQEHEDVEEESAPSALAHRAVPSHFYPEAKARSTEWCGTHTRFEEDDAADPAPVSEEMNAAIDALGQVRVFYLFFIFFLEAIQICLSLAMNTR
jgi:hypothetical protein